jgi:hypothetical protein
MPGPPPLPEASLLSPLHYAAYSPLITHFQHVQFTRLLLEQFLGGRSPHLERAISAGLLVRHEGDQETGAPAEPAGDDGDPQAAEESVVDLSKLRAAEALSTVEAEHDSVRLKAHLEGEERRTVIAALEKRLAEVDAGDR